MSREFPAINWLGYSVDMSGMTPMDISAASNAVQTTRRIISYDLDDTRQVTVGGITYDVPRMIGVAADDDGNSGSYITFGDGNQASIAFSNDSSLALRYFAVTGDPTVAASTDKVFRRNDQYAFFNYNQNSYLATLRDYVDSINTTALLAGIRDLPTPFNGSNESTLQKYKDFFQRFGSHIVTKVRYGARLQLNVWASNQNASVNDNWSTNVNAEFGGIPSGGRYDSSVQSQAQYKVFRELMQKLITVTGGDQVLAADIVVDPNDYSVYENWTKTIQQRMSLLGLVVTEIWSLMRSSLDHELNNASHYVEEGFRYIIANPKVYKTAISLDVQSDWAEFGLITPQAVIVPGSTVPPNTQLSETKLTWGKELSHDYQRQTINFYVINDGYPIDFYISHGSSGSASGSGNARVTMEGRTYVNDRITDNNWNTMWYYQALVSANSQRFIGGVPRDGTVRIWDTLLEQYLTEFRNKDESERDEDM